MVHATVKVSPGSLETTHQKTIVLKYVHINPNLKMIFRGHRNILQNGTFFKYLDNFSRQ